MRACSSSAEAEGSRWPARPPTARWSSGPMTSSSSPADTATAWTAGRNHRGRDLTAFRDLHLPASTAGVGPAGRWEWARPCSVGAAVASCSCLRSPRAARRTSRSWIMCGSPCPHIARRRGTWDRGQPGGGYRSGVHDATWGAVDPRSDHREWRVLLAAAGVRPARAARRSARRSDSAVDPGWASSAPPTS